MKIKLVTVPTPRLPIKLSPGFAKKHLSTRKVDLAGRCGYGCGYCSSDNGNYLRIHREEFASLTEVQTGSRTVPSTDPSLSFVWEDVIPNLEQQLADAPSGWGAGETLVFSMLTDGFSPWLVGHGVTERALSLLLEGSLFRIRILTKNAVVGSDRWLRFFGAYRDRFIVGLSIGTLDDAWSARIELGTSHPTSRIRAHRRLQDAGIATYGMLCPVFPDAARSLDSLLDQIRPERCETVWAEAFNDRANWQHVAEGYPVDSADRAWLHAVYERHDWALWSAYATDLYSRLITRSRRDGWSARLKYLLYEKHVVERDAAAFRDLDGVLLQGPPASDGETKNRWLRAARGLPVVPATSSLTIASHDGGEHE